MMFSSKNQKTYKEEKMIVSERRKKCFAEFKKTGLDGVLYAGGANFQYLAECTSYFWQRNCFNLQAPVAGSHIIPECLV